MCINDKSPHIILVAPQLGENIGMAARAMRNCAVSSLYLVTPRDGWPNPAAKSAAVGASQLIDDAVVFDDIATAVSGVKRVYAMTARRRSRDLPQKNLEQAVEEIVAEQKKGIECAILFGAERSGLDNDMISFADMLVNIPVNPDFPSINLSQSVMLFCYEWRKAWFRINQDKISDLSLPIADKKQSPLADKKELINFLIRLEDRLDAQNFFKNPQMRKETVRNLRAFFQRAKPSEQELNTLHGVVARLSSFKE